MRPTTPLPAFLGWFSIGLGALEIAAPGWLGATLGLRTPPWVLRLFGAREAAAGLLILARPASLAGPWARTVGDAIDLAVLAPALSSGNPKRARAAFAFAAVVGITALDITCSLAPTTRPD